MQQKGVFMTISSSLNAGVAGLTANATRLATISDNIANSATYGYKRMEADFHSMVISSTGDTYSAGGVRTTTQRLIDERGALVAIFVAFLGCSGAALASDVRIKDLVEFDGVRGNDLIGYGLVVGLNGTGDGIRNAPFTEEIMSNILERLGVNVSGEQYRPKNVAAVFVTAELPAFARAGGTIDMNVSAIGDAKSLMGGTLIMTPLNAADR